MFKWVKKLVGGGNTTPETTAHASTVAAQAPPLRECTIGPFGPSLDGLEQVLRAQAESSRDSTPRSEATYLSASAINRLRPLLAKVKPGIACEEIKNSHVGTALAAEHPHFRAHQEFIAKEKSLCIDSLLLEGEKIRNRARGFFTNSVNEAISEESYDGDGWTGKMKQFSRNSKNQNEQTQNEWVELNRDVARFKESLGRIWEQGKKLGETITADMTSPLAPDLNVNVSLDEDVERGFENYFTTFDPWSEKTKANLERMRGGIEPMLVPVLKGLEHLSDMRERQQELQDAVIARARKRHSL